MIRLCVLQAAERIVAHCEQNQMLSKDLEPRFQPGWMASLRLISILTPIGVTC